MTTVPVRTSAIADSFRTSSRCAREYGDEAAARLRGGRSMTVSSEFDPGPPAAIAKHLAKVPELQPPSSADWFWYDWGPVFYRGRLNGSAKLLGDRLRPRPERAGRGTHARRRRGPAGAGLPLQARPDALVRARQRLRLRAAAVALRRRPADADRGPRTATWRNKLLDDVTGPAAGDRRLRDECAEGARALELAAVGARRSKSRTPAAGTPRSCVNEWRAAVDGPPRDRDARLRTANADAPNYGTTLQGERLRAASRRATCRSGCPPGSATTRGGGRRARGTTTASNGPAAT